MINQNVYPVPETVYVPIHEWQEDDTLIVIKNEASWQAIDPDRLDWDIGVLIDATNATEAMYERVLAQAQDMGDAVYAVGGGVVVDIAKYVAHELDLPLISVPTALSVDAFWTWSSGKRKNGVVRYVPTTPPEIVLVDFDIIGQAPSHVRSAGIIDVLSIATACADWEMAERKGKNSPDQAYDRYVARNAQAILQNALDLAPAAGQGDIAGLRALVDSLVMEVQLCNLAFHARAEEGSEHYFAYCAEWVDEKNGLTSGLRTHGDYVGPGIVLMAEKHGLNAAGLERALNDAGVPMNSLPAALISETLNELANYVRKHNLPYGIAWES
jgi:glycerol-1-phosphate dehydrogenase [NAD(P)+]